MPLCIKAIARCESCEANEDDEIFLHKWYPNWGAFSSILGEKGWLMKPSKNGESWEFYCPKCRYFEENPDKK